MLKKSGYFGCVTTLSPELVRKKGVISSREVKALFSLQESGISPRIERHRLNGVFFYTPDINGKMVRVFQNSTITMENLHDYVEMSDLGLPLSQEVYGNFFKSLAKLHLSGWYHNDIHEGNIMVNPETGSVKLVDFGLSGRDYYLACLEALSCLDHLEEVFRLPLFFNYPCDVRDSCYKRLYEVNKTLKKNLSVLKKLHEDHNVLSPPRTKGIHPEYKILLKLIYKGIWN